MTIEVSICNKDDHKTLVVTQLELDATRGHVKHRNESKLAPHQTATWHVHALRNIEISEEIT